MWVDSELVDETSSVPLSLRYPHLCARVEVDGLLHDIDVVSQTPAAVAKLPVKILVDGEVVHGDAFGSPQSLIEPSVWARVRTRGFWAYALGESPKGILLLCPAIVALVLASFELGTTLLLGLLSTWAALVGVPLLTWFANERRWRMRQRRLNEPHKLHVVELQRPPDAA